MTWFKVDDQLAFHPKVVAAGLPAMGLWIRAGTWSASARTDGLILPDMVAPLNGKPADIRALVKAELWEEAEDGYQMHDWHDYQPSRTEVDNVRSTRTTAGKFGAHRRWHGNNPSPECPYCQ